MNTTEEMRKKTEYIFDLAYRALTHKYGDTYVKDHPELVIAYMVTATQIHRDLVHQEMVESLKGLMK